ncbi:AAA family ATPase [Paenibacillus septentrionalis]|uniref:AAA family ATPase n=1 Tax=Paenibacillus septentrionalis TaxID=429342 RepID=A0ABW1V2T5_9BACL
MNTTSSTAQSMEQLSANYTWSQPPAQLLQRMEQRLGQVLLGKQTAIRDVMIGLLAGGHLLIEDVPGVGKTMLATSIARLLGGKFHRIQFTSDLLPADIIGGMIMDAQGRGLVYREGPIMANVVLGDELNRASSKSQSALLEALEHRSVSIEGVTHPLPQPFVFIATQNPLRYEGTNRLLEAQLDRFMLQLSLGYPGQQVEQELLEQFAAARRPKLELLRAVISHEEWQQMQAELQRVYVHPSLIGYMTEVAAFTRADESLVLGLSPRALRDWLRAAQASAYMQSRGFIVPDDLLHIGATVLAHRIELKSYPNTHQMKRDYVNQVLQRIPVSRNVKERSR